MSCPQYMFPATQGSAFLFQVSYNWWPKDRDAPGSSGSQDSWMEFESQLWCLLVGQPQASHLTLLISFPHFSNNEGWFYQDELAFRFKMIISVRNVQICTWNNKHIVALSTVNLTLSELKYFLSERHQKEY